MYTSYEEKHWHGDTNKQRFRMTKIFSLNFFDKGFFFNKSIWFYEQRENILCFEFIFL